MNGAQKAVIAIIAVTIVSAAIFAVVNARPLDISSTSFASDKRDPLVVTSFAPIANIVEDVGGDRIEILRIIPDSEASHTFKLSVTDGIIIKTRADIVIINGLGLEDAARESTNPKLKLLKLADSVITRDEWIFDNSFPEEKGNPNPLLWLNVEYATKYTELVRDELSMVDPENAEYYDSNADRYLQLLRQLYTAIAHSVQTIPLENRKLVSYHDSLPYFAKRYGLEVVAALQPADFGEPTKDEITAIIHQINAEKVPAIFASEVFPNDVTERIASEAHVEVVRTLRDDSLPGQLNDFQHTYVGMMVANVRTIVTALGGDASGLEDIDPGNTYQR